MNNIKYKRYWSAIFSRETWEVFLKGKADTMGFRRKLKSMNNIKKGDYFICYISRIPGNNKKLALFAGVLEVTSDYFFDENQIWEKDIFPNRFNVKVIKSLNIAHAIEVISLKDKLEFFKNLKNPNKWAGFFLAAPREFSVKDGETIVKAIMNKSIS